MRRHVHRAQRVAEVFCSLGAVDAKRDCSRPVGPPCDHVQRGTKPYSIYIVKRNRTFDGMDSMAWAYGLGVRAAAELAPGL